MKQMNSIQRQPCPSRPLLSLLGTVAIGLAFPAQPGRANPEPSGLQLVNRAKLPAGLIVYNGAHRDQVAALRPPANCVVHLLCPDADRVAAMRTLLLRQARNGTISADRRSGDKLPYGDKLVNLLIDESGKLPLDEIQRVLIPGGSAYVRSSTGAKDWREIRKPWPEELDEWTHYLHNPTGNPVARDDAVRPPRQLQWLSEPEWARHHEHMASMSALVSAGGIVFTICDEGPLTSMFHPPRWTLTARDAFNGLLLWRRPIADWFSHLHPLKNGPASLPRRLVADGERVYVTLGIDAPVSVLDARTGTTLRTCQHTSGTRELILSEGRLFLVRQDDSGMAVAAADPSNGNVLWEHRSPVAALTLAADSKQVVFFDGAKIIALSPDTGMVRWSSAPLPEQSKANWIAKNPPRLILHENTLIIALHKAVYTLSGASGELLWSSPQPLSGYMSPKDLFVIDGLVWFGDTAGARDSGRFEGRDLITGEVRRSFLPDKEAVWLSHHRCHFSKATRNYILPARMGVEFVDLQRQEWTPNHWVRGGCIYGVMPCNGLLYAPPHACACYFETKLHGFIALTSTIHPAPPMPDRDRLETGPAYPDPPDERPGAAAEDWPTLRRDPARNGAGPTSVPAAPAMRWQVALGGRLSQPVVSDGRVYVSSIDTHTLHALNEDDGQPLWSFTAGGRIDSPPTIHRGRVLFGSRDGWIYALRASDGALAWRYRAFPRESLLMAYGQLESAWPVSGSVLIENGELHCVAGRNMFLDGGLRYLRLDPVTGEKLSETVMDVTDPLDGGSIEKHDSWLDMTTTLPDVLSSDGESVYMRSLPFDLTGKRRRITHLAGEDEPPHLFSPTGFLDGNWFHRSYWTYAKTFPGGWVGHLNAGRYNPSGRLLVIDGDTIFGFGRKPQYYRWTTSLEYRLFAVDRSAHETRDIYAYDFFKEAQQANFPGMKIDKQMGLPSGPRPKEKLPTYATTWEIAEPPVLVTAMVSTRDALFVAGPEDVSEEGEMDAYQAGKQIQGREAEWERQAALWRGEEGALLLAICKKSGNILSRQRLDSLPVFDGLIAANGRLLLTSRDGTLRSLGKTTTNQHR